MNSNHHLMQTILCSWLQMLCSTTSIFWLAVSSWQLLVLSHVHVLSRGWLSELIFQPISVYVQPQSRAVCNYVGKGRAVNVVLGFLTWIRVVRLWECLAGLESDPPDPMESSGFPHLIPSHAFSHFLLWIPYSVTNECICIPPLPGDSWLLGSFQPESQTAASLRSLGTASRDGCPPALACVLPSHIIPREQIFHGMAHSETFIHL